MNIQTLINNLSLDDETERMFAAEDLGDVESPEAVAALVERLPVETSRKVRETLFTALERINRPEVLSRIVMFLESDDAFLRNQAISLLQRKGAASAPVLLERMHDANPDVRKFVIDTAAGIPSTAVDPIFEAAIRDPDVNVLIAGLEHLGAQRKKQFKWAVEGIFLEATEPMLVSAAFAALLQIGDADSWQCILRRYPAPATVPGWELGWWIRGLGNFGLAGEIEVFHELLKSHDGKMARDIMDALECFQIRHGSEENTGALGLSGGGL